MSILLGILTFVLILVSLFLVLIVLMQKSKDGGMGATLGGGAAEAAFGADTTNVLSQATKYSAILFSTATACARIGRGCVGMEIDAAYIETARKRILDVTALLL